MARLAQAASVLRVVRVEAGGDQVAPAERPVVSVDGGHAALAGVAVALVGAHAQWVASEDASAEPLLVAASVSALPCGAALLLGLGSVGGASAGGGELGAAVD
ncbi:hypothetical protein ABZS83_33005 [Streptomyces sp. NPDC005426]|uniref:hypothetical protein n=1 Tax=Streptomyces sp. NPDC005426 TaxID=3155344 RepID=UPI0033A26011